MHGVSLWLFAYAIPALVTGGIVHCLSRCTINPTRDAVIIHAGLGISILASHIVLHTLGVTFPWHPYSLSIFIYGASTIFSIRMLGLFGMWYSLSAFLQQLTMLSVSFVLFPLMPLPLILLLVVPIFAFGHAQNVHHRSIRVMAISLWGVAAITLFAIVPDIYLLAALHTLLGTLGIQRSIVYPR